MTPKDSLLESVIRKMMKEADAITKEVWDYSTGGTHVYPDEFRDCIKAFARLNNIELKE